MYRRYDMRRLGWGVWNEGVILSRRFWKEEGKPKFWGEPRFKWVTRRSRKSNLEDGANEKKMAAIPSQFKFGRPIFIGTLNSVNAIFFGALLHEGASERAVKRAKSILAAVPHAFHAPPPPRFASLLAHTHTRFVSLEHHVDCFENGSSL